MAAYELTRRAMHDVGRIISYLHREKGAEAANKMEDQLFKAFVELGALVGIGHRRPDLTGKDVFFYASRPYVIVFRRKKTIAQVIHVLHEKQDIQKIL